MSRVEITTLNADLIEAPTADYFEEAEVVLSFGDAEIKRWRVAPPYFRYDDDRRRFLEEFIADRLRILFEQDGSAPND